MAAPAVKKCCVACGADVFTTATSKSPLCGRCVGPRRRKRWWCRECGVLLEGEEWAAEPLKERLCEECYAERRLLFGKES